MKVEVNEVLITMTLKEATTLRRFLGCMSTMDYRRLLGDENMGNEADKVCGSIFNTLKSFFEEK